MTVVDSRSPATPGAPAQAPQADGGPARPAAITRDPEVRLETLFDPGTMRLLTPHDASGALAATGEIGGTLAAAFASD
ncbi:MAG TPA: propionyl-CoA carboxylase subunit beta, partial [Actinobacteria bacterium]|nr:propionyl-CoA carboxylase subunit beta [Actinomycetota bacterium]